MAEIIDMPKLSDTMTVGTLVTWLKKEGDKIEPGDMIAEIETDKATMELENFEEGVLLKQFVKEGEQVPVGAPIASVGEEGEVVPDAEPAVAAPAKAEQVPQAVEVAVDVKPVVAQAQELNFSVQPGERVIASPLARKMAVDLGVSLHSVKGTGPNGRVVKDDVISASNRQPAVGDQPSAPAVSAAAPVISPTMEAQDIPVSNMRRAIAQHLVTSKTTVPHFYLDIEVDAAPLLKLRADLNQHYLDSQGEGAMKLTVNDLILKATSDAIIKVPGINTSWQGDVIKQFDSIHLSFGVAIPDGLLTPVIRDSQSKSLIQISQEAKELVGKARSKKLTPNEMTGSTFTVTNLGMYGINNFFGIINPPNAGILSVGATVTKPVVNADGNIVPGQRMNIGFSGDHRVIDGSTGAEFLQSLKKIIETPALMLT